MNKLILVVLLVSMVSFVGCEKKHSVSFGKSGVTWK